MTDLEFLNQKGHDMMRLPDYEGEPQEDRWEPAPKGKVRITVYNVWELDAKGRLNRSRGSFVAEKDNPPIKNTSDNIRVEEMYKDDIPFWLEWGMGSKGGI